MRFFFPLRVIQFFEGLDTTRMYVPRRTKTKPTIPTGSNPYGSKRGQLVPGLLHCILRYSSTLTDSAYSIPIIIRNNPPAAKIEIPMIDNFFTESTPTTALSYV